MGLSGSSGTPTPGSPGNQQIWSIRINLHCKYLLIRSHTLRSVNDVTEGITQKPPMGDS